MQNRLSKNLSLFILALAFLAFVYGTYKAIVIVSKTQVGTRDGVYTSYVSRSVEIQKRAEALTQGCESRLCKVQSLLDFVSAIPYATQTFQRKKPLQTIADNFGDCDDKSNLLISLLHSLGIEGYFVLVPKHIFVIVPLDDVRLEKREGLWVNGKKYYILEGTAKGSSVGFPLHYSLKEIDAIVEPFSNKKIVFTRLQFKP